MFEILNQMTSKTQCYQTNELGIQVPVMLDVTSTTFANPDQDPDKPIAQTVHIKEDGIVKLIAPIKYLPPATRQPANPF